MTPAQRRNVSAQKAGYKNYYALRKARADVKHGGNISTGQKRGHPNVGEIHLSTVRDIRSRIHEHGRAAAFAYVQDEGIEISHDQWSLIFGSPKLRSHSR
jgi:hypothetical protein